MLVLNRKLRESIVIADNIVVTVVGIQGGSVRLAFEAPPDIAIHRAEVQSRIDQERAKADSLLSSPAA